MSVVNFPFRYEQYTLNEENLIKFINTDTNHFGLCKFSQNNIYLLNNNNRNYIIIYTPDNSFEFFYNYDEDTSSFITQNNTRIERKSTPLFKYLCTFQDYYIVN